MDSSEIINLSSNDSLKSTNFGPGIELLMNDKTKNSRPKHDNIDLEDINALEAELNDVSSSIENINLTNEIEEPIKLNFDSNDNDNFNNIDQLSRIILGCREVYCISNTSAHLSAALGHPTNVILPFNHTFNSWYWFQDKSRKSLWYANTVIIEAMQNNPIDSALKQIT